MSTRPVPSMVQVLLLVIPAILVATLFAASLYAHRELRNIDEEALSLTSNAVPSVQHLTSARTALRRFSLEVDAYINEPDRAPAGDPTEPIRLSRQHLAAEIAAYDKLPVYDGEKEIRSQLDPALADVDAAVTRIEAAAREGDRQLADRMFDQQGRLAINRADTVLVSLAILNVEQARAAAVNIAQAQNRSTTYGFLLDGVSVVLAVVAASLAWRMARSNQVLAAQREELSRLSEELDQFSGRMAHDVLSPLSSVSLALGTALRRLGPDDDAARLVSRAYASLMRIEPLVHGLLDFARAAARPEPGARTDVRTALDEAASDTRAEADEAGEELRVASDPGLQVACAPAVLASVLSNLIRNAIKYTRTSPVRRIDVRAVGAGDRVRIEVEDTGPGLTAEMARAVFEPYVRGAGVGEPGVGLGLATVRRFTEAHGGKVGVDSAPNQGSRFWVELPRAV